MSQENLDLAVRGTEAALKRPKPDFETLNLLFHPDHVYVPLTAHEFGEAEAKGGSGFKVWLEQTSEVVNWEGDLRGAVDIGPDHVLLVTDNRFRGSSSGAETAQRCWCLLTVIDGKITRSDIYIDPAQALKAAGLSE